MASSAIENLRQAIVAAGTGTLALDAAFLQKGLNDPNVALPPQYDQHVQAAFQVASAADFSLGLQNATVGALSNDAFTVAKASLPFPGVAQAPATLVFALATNADTSQSLVVQIASTPPGWVWTTSFQAMAGWPFDQLVISKAQFVFSTADGFYPWADHSGLSVLSGAVQNLFANVQWPSQAQPLLALFNGLKPPGGALALAGVLDFTEYNGTTVLYPAGTLDALLSHDSFPLLYLTVAQPRLRLSIPPPPDPGTDEGADQAPMLALAAGLGVAGLPKDQSPYLLDVVIMPAEPGADDQQFLIGLTATGDGPQLSPASIVALAGGGGSYFGAVPPILQQFLAAVGLQGLSLAGQLGKPLTLTSISALAVQIGSAKGTHWQPIPDPTGKLDFTITSFYLNWSIMNPFDAKTRQQSVLLGTQFTLAPAIFKGPGGVGDGVFTVEFTSGLQFYAAFDGTATLSDFLTTLTNGAVSLPTSIQASLSNIRLALDYNTRSFSFSSGFDVSLAFLTIDGQPILSISNGEVRIAAKTPTQPAPKALPTSALIPAGADPNAATNTVWYGEVSGLLAIGPLGANVSVVYDGMQTPARWMLHAALARPINVQDLIKQFFDPNGSYDFPDFLPGTLTIKTFVIDASIPSGKGDTASSYTISTSFSWLFQLGDQSVGISAATIGLAYDGAKLAGQRLSGYAEGTWVYDAINLELTLGYKFVPSAQGGSKTLYLVWEGFRAEYDTGKQLATFTLKGWSIGALIQALVRTLGDPYFTLPSPWDFLDKISLDGLSVMVSLKSGDTNRVSASYTLASPIDLGFIQIKGLIFARDTSGKVTLAIDGTIPAPLLAGVPPADRQKLQNLTNPGAGQDVKDMPSVPGRGEQSFKLFLLALGQRVGITGHASFANTQAVIAALQKLPSTTGKQNPVNPNANQGSPPAGLPYYSPANNWLIAAHLGLLQAAGVWTIDAMIVFNDPDLYGLRLALAGDKVGGLKGLAIDIMYKKITDDIGMFQIEFSFPDAIRNLNFGAVSITLPQLGLQIYTNGDFLIDVGFPYNLDFRRSFSIAAIVYGVPVLGAGGFYFGKLSSATATQVPKTNQGTFDPVIVFGLGLQLGLGYNFTKGPLSAGFAVTVFGIVEGVLAPWHPYAAAAGQALVAAGSALQSGYYFKLSGTVGIIALLYGKIDFAIIQAAVYVRFTVSLQITYESYRAIPLVVTATVEISIKLKIDLWLFSITISLSFSATVSAKFVIGSDEAAPWDDHPARIAGLARGAGLLSAGPQAARLCALNLRPRPKRVSRGGAPNPVLHLLIAPPFTVLAPEGSADYAAQAGAFVLLLSIDAPAADGTGNSGDTSFGRLCAGFFPWAIDALSQSAGDTVDLAAASASIVTRADLECYIEKLADLNDPAFSIADLLGFLASGFELAIETPSYAQSSGTQPRMQAGSTLFPVFDGLALAVPNPAGGTAPIDFATYTTATSAYRSAVAAIFEQVEATIAQQNQRPSRTRLAADDPESLAGLVFVDTFALIGRQLLQAALDALDSYAYTLGASDTLQGIIRWANLAGNALTIDDIALPNQDHPLTAATELSIAGLAYTVQAGDTLTAIAARYSDPHTAAPRWATTPAQLILANGPARVLQPGVTLTLQGQQGTQSYTTGPGDSFAQIAATLGIGLDKLAAQPVLYGAQGLLASAAALSLPSISYTSAGSAGSGPSTDTLRSVAALFATSVPQLAAANTGVAGLFAIDAEQGVITLAQLAALEVADLWKSIQATDQVAQTAGMVARFLMFGLRMPNAAGLALSNTFLYPSGQSGYGMYQLTGQQFPVPALAPGASYTISLARAAQAHGVDLSFISFNGASGTSVQVDLTQPYANMAVVLAWARAGNFTPAPSFAELPPAARTPKAFAINSFARWSTSDMAGLLQLTDRGAAPTADPSSQPQPILWPLPPSLLNLAAARQGSLAPLFAQLRDALPLLPQFQPQVGSTSPASQRTAYTNLQRWAWATRVDLQIKRMPQAAATEPGPPSALANVYELVGPASQDALLLESLLSTINALGEDVISGVFLLYEQPGTASQLVTLASQEFLAFITQTNLSTETNPPRSSVLAVAGGTPPRGIANAPGQFVKLLWELSVVRSGGYYLFYQVIDGGAGLPAAIFDSSGSATVSLVVTYAAQGPQSFGTSVLDFVNAFVSTDAIDSANDIVQVVSQAASAPSAPLGSGATLAGLAATYGVGVGQVAAANATLPLVDGTVIPVAGIVRQLELADLHDPATTLANLAAYYSAGARQPISAADIASFNPGVAVRLGALFAIPPIAYVVAAAAAPGNRLGSIAAYYGLALDALAVGAAQVGGLFPAGAPISIATQLFDVRPSLRPGNLAVQLARANMGQPPDLPPNPTPAQQAAYAEAVLYALYNTLSAGIAQNSYFTASPLGLPFGPQLHDGGDDAAFASHARLNAHRRTRLLAAAAADYDYRQALGFGQFSLVNPAPAAPAAGLPPQSANPYVGVGSSAQIALRWQDVFGNTTVTPFDTPPAGYTGAISGAAVPIRYSDQLVGVAAWPNVQASHSYAGSSGAPVLQLNFSLDINNYSGDLDQAARDLALYQQIYFQLSQDYTNLKVPVPGVSGNAVTMFVHNALLAAPDLQLSEAQAGVIRSFVGACVQYLHALVNPGAIAVAQPQAQLAMPVALDALVPDSIIELDVRIAFARQALLTDPAVAALPDGLVVTSPLLPQADGGNSVAYTQYATAFEQVFQTTGWYMKVGTGLPQAGQAGTTGARQLWAARFGSAPGQGISFTIGATPSYYAPLPVATSLTSRSATIIDYSTGQSVQSSFTGVDQNLWFQASLDAIDRFLAAEYAAPAFILDKELGANDPLKDGYLGKVLAAKQSLADSISATVRPILSTSAGDASTAWAAREQLRQQLLNQIGAAYAAGAVVVFGLSDVSGAPPHTPAGPPSLYGQPIGTIDGAALNQNYTLSPTKIALGPISATVKGATTSYEPRLAFVFTTKNIAEQAFVPLDLRLKISHLEFARTSVPGIAGYVQSQWLAFVNGPFEYPLGAGAANIPVLNRALPSPPTVQKQAARRHSSAPATPAELAQWDYSFDYLYRQAAQDAVQIEIDLNYTPPLARPDDKPAQPDLFTALAQLVGAYPAIERDFGSYLAKIGAEPVDEATLKAAQKAVAAFAEYINAIATAYAGSLVPNVHDLTVLPELVQIDFLYALQPDQDGNAQAEIIQLTINRQPATWNPAAHTISAGAITLPEVVIQIDPALYQAEPVSPPPANVSIAYRYRLIAPEATAPTYLTYAKASAIPTRTVALVGLDVLMHQNAWASIQVQRNRILFPTSQIGQVGTNHDFIFQTPPVKFADPIVPRLVYQDFSLDTHGDMEAGPANLAALLEAFFAGLFAGGDGQISVEVAMSSAYSYALLPGASTLPRVALPISLLPPAEASVGARVPAFIAPFAQAIDDWQRQQHPTDQGAPQINIQLQVFGASTAKQPLLVVYNLGHAVA